MTPAELLSRRAAIVIALVGIGLLVSLLPPTDFVIDATAEPDGTATLSPVYAGHGVEQSLGDPASPVLRARIWTAAGLDGPPVAVTVSLVAGDENEPIRQFTFDARPGSEPTPRTVQFQPYDPPRGREVKLQIVVAPDGANFVSVGIAARNADVHGEFAQPTLNREPLSFLAPVAYRLEGQGLGLRAALFHGGQERARLTGAVIALVAAAIVWLYGLRIFNALLDVPPLVAQRRPAPGRRRLLFFYPWLIAVFPILYFYSTNVLVFEFGEFAPIIAVSLGAVTVLALAVWIVVRDAAVAAATIALTAAVFFAYGHVYDALGSRLDHPVLLPIAAALPLALGLLIVKRARWARNGGRFLNYASLPLVAIPAVSVGLVLAAPLPEPKTDIEIEAAARSATITQRPDIYYIILDAYGRADSLEPFDNTPFLSALEQRGFYVAPQAQSNYPMTEMSIPSSLNMRYPEGFDRFDDAVKRAGRELTKDHLVGRILTALGYKYVHLVSGFSVTNSSDRADLLVDFAPSGPIVVRNRDRSPTDASEPRPAANRAVRAFARTTLLRPFADAYFPDDAESPFWLTHPGRALATFEYLKTIPDLDDPTFTVAHVIKPHGPYQFDRHGNVAINLLDGFAADHDPSVPGPYFGQLLYVNTLVLDTVDHILAESDETPLIIITSDHGADFDEESLYRNDILAAFLLPGGGEQAMYPSITSVNMFRVVLDYYFDLGLGRLEDRVITLKEA